MHDFFSFIILGLIQGMAEFLPVSSSGHLILARVFFGFTANNGLAIDAVLQLATVLAVIVYFRKDLFDLTVTLFRRIFGKSVSADEERLMVALIIGTVPAVIVGYLLEDIMATVFRNSHLVAYALVVGSAIMFFAEYASHRLKSFFDVSHVGVGKAFLIGLFQTLALIPGMSRSGMTISGGLFLGLSRESAARFGFLLAVPIILGSGLKKLLELGVNGTLSAVGPELLVGSAVAFVSGLAAIHALLLFVRTQPLYAFIAYRLALAILIFAFL